MVTLKTIDDQHIDNTFHWLQNRALRAQIDCIVAPELASHRRYWQQKLSNEKSWNRAVIDQDGVHIGNCGFDHIDRQRKKAEYWIYLAVTHTGAGTLATGLALDYAFTDMKLERVYLRVLATNTDAIRFYLRMGFTIEGRLRHDTYVDGVAIDSLQFSMLTAEYAALIKT